jgi:membrane protease YdiL (CAAX protease family)
MATLAPSERAPAESSATASRSAVTWSAGDAMLVVLAAGGALRLAQTFLFALHLPDAELNRALGTLGASGLLFGAAVMGVRRAGHRNVETALGIRFPRPFDWATGIVFGMALFLVSVSIQQFINEHFASWVNWYAAARQPVDLAHGPWILLSLVWLFTVPVAEESLFRGFFHRGLRTRYSTPTAILLSAALFAAYHHDPATMPAHFVSGVALALAFEWRGTLAMPMVIHSTINACFLIRELFG